MKFRFNETILYTNCATRIFDETLTQLVYLQTC